MMGYLCATCGGVGGLFETSHAHSDKDSCISELRAKATSLRDELKAKDLEVHDLRAALDRDKTGLAGALAAIREEVKGRRWICDGRGSYTYDDDRYRKETGFALDAIEKIAGEALSASGKLAHETLMAKGKDEKPPCGRCGNILRGPHDEATCDYGNV